MGPCSYPSPHPAQGGGAEETLGDREEGQITSDPGQTGEHLRNARTIINSDEKVGPYRAAPSACEICAANDRLGSEAEVGQ